MAGIYLELGKRTGRRGEVLELPGTSFLVGRSSDCQVRLGSDSVSRWHARLHLDGREWFIEDLQSHNGTYLNGRKVTAAALRPLDKIRLGKARGANIRVLSLDPAPRMATDGDDAPTRHPRTRREQKARARSSPAGTAKPRRARPSRRPPAEDLPVYQPISPGPSPRPRAEPSGALDTLRTTHVLTILGLAFGLLTAWGAWGGAFPYLRVSAPVLWALRGVEIGAPDLLLENGDWLLRFLLALWFGMIGLVLERPIRRFVPLLCLGAAHGGAIAAFSL